MAIVNLLSAILAYNHDAQMNVVCRAVKDTFADNSDLGALHGETDYDSVAVFASNANCDRVADGRCPGHLLWRSRGGLGCLDGCRRLRRWLWWPRRWCCVESECGYFLGEAGDRTLDVGDPALDVGVTVVRHPQSAMMTSFLLLYIVL
jgi:hypothetical protein